MSERTWFGTLTTTPEWDTWVDAHCSTRKRNFGLLPPEEQFDEQALVLGTEVTKYLKRVRKNSGCQFRYLLVTEIHNSAETGILKRHRPHCHLLIHETAAQPIRKRVLDGAWHLGHCQFRLTENKSAAYYISKYISKATNTRVRASLGYGQGPAFVDVPQANKNERK